MTRLAHCPLQSGISCFCIYHRSFPVDWWLSLDGFLWLERERTSCEDVNSVVEFRSRSFALKVYIEQQISSFSCRPFDSVRGKGCSSVVYFTRKMVASCMSESNLVTGSTSPKDALMMLLIRILQKNLFLFIKTTTTKNIPNGNTHSSSGERKL